MKQNKIPVEEHKCVYCNRVFKNEKNLFNHSCVKKLRFLDKDTRTSRIGFAAFQKFYVTVQRSKKLKTFDDFINSKFYIEFIKFGKYVVDNNILNPDYFIDFCLKNGLKLRDWMKDSVYETYLREINKKEDSIKAAERTILLMKQWSDDTDNNYNDFFRLVDPMLFIHYSKLGRISPWVLYNCDSGKEFLENKITPDQLNIIIEWIDPDYWMKKFRMNKSERQFLQKILKKEGL